MRRASSVVLVLGGVILGGASALAADSGPVIVLPGRHGLPVILNGVDVTGAVLEGDWGLYSPHMVGPTIIPAPVFIPGRAAPRDRPPPPPAPAPPRPRAPIAPGRASPIPCRRASIRRLSRRP